MESIRAGAGRHTVEGMEKWKRCDNGDGESDGGGEEYEKLHFLKNFFRVKVK